MRIFLLSRIKSPSRPFRPRQIDAASLLRLASLGDESESFFTLKKLLRSPNSPQALNAWRTLYRFHASKLSQKDYMYGVKLLRKAKRFDDLFHSIDSMRRASEPVMLPEEMLKELLILAEERQDPRRIYELTIQAIRKNVEIPSRFYSRVLVRFESHSEVGKAWKIASCLERRGRIDMEQAEILGRIACKSKRIDFLKLLVKSKDSQVISLGFDLLWKLSENSHEILSETLQLAKTCKYRFELHCFWTAVRRFSGRKDFASLGALFRFLRETEYLSVQFEYFVQTMENSEEDSKLLFVKSKSLLKEMCSCQANPSLVTELRIIVWLMFCLAPLKKLPLAEWWLFHDSFQQHLESIDYFVAVNWLNRPSSSRGVLRLYEILQKSELPLDKFLLTSLLHCALALEDIDAAVQAVERSIENRIDLDIQDLMTLCKELLVRKDHEKAKKILSRVPMNPSMYGSTLIPPLWEFAAREEDIDILTSLARFYNPIVVESDMLSILSLLIRKDVFKFQLVLDEMLKKQVKLSEEFHSKLCDLVLESKCKKCAVSLEDYIEHAQVFLSDKQKRFLTQLALKENLASFEKLPAESLFEEH